jgi:glycosyltransferase 2 family protein
LKVSVQTARAGALKVGILLGLILLVKNIIYGVEAFEKGPNASLNVGWLALAIFVSALGMLQQVWIWYRVLVMLGVNLSFFNIAIVYLRTFVARYIPGSIWGYLGRSDWINRENGVSLVLLNYSSALEIFLAIISSILGIAIGSLEVGSPLEKAFRLFLFPVFITLTWYLIVRIRRIVLMSRILNFGITPSTRWRDWFLVTFMFTLNWIYYGVALYLVGLSMNEWKGQFTIGFIFLLTGKFSLAWFVGFITLIFPSGIGLRESVLAYLLSDLPGATLQVASAMAILMRAVNVSAELLCFGLTFLPKSISNFFLNR